MPSPATVIEFDLAAWIEALADCQSAGAKVYPFKAVPQNPTWPFVTYHRVFGSRIRSTTGPVGVSRPVIQLDVFAKTYRACKLLAAAIREALDALSGDTLAGRTVQVAIAEDVGEADDDGDSAEAPPHGDEVTQFRETIPLRLWYQET